MLTKSAGHPLLSSLCILSCSFLIYHRVLGRLLIKKIGWLATGVMGNSTCGHVLAAAYPVAVYNRTKSKANELLDKGAKWCDTPKEVAENSDIIISIVVFPTDVEEVILGTSGVLAGVKAGSIIADMTTSEPSLAKKYMRKPKAKACFPWTLRYQVEILVLETANWPLWLVGIKRLMMNCYRFLSSWEKILPIWARLVPGNIQK